MARQPLGRGDLEDLRLKGLGSQVTGLGAPAVGAVEGFLRSGGVEGETGDKVDWLIRVTLIRGKDASDRGRFVGPTVMLQLGRFG